MITAQTLAQRQAYPLDLKIGLSENRIRHWYDTHAGNVSVAFSGGKDSTVLLHLVRSLYPEVPAVFVDTGLEYPEIRDFVSDTENVTWLRPRMSFKQVIEKKGRCPRRRAGTQSGLIGSEQAQDPVRRCSWFVWQTSGQMAIPSRCPIRDQ